MPIGMEVMVWVDKLVGSAVGNTRICGYFAWLVVWYEIQEEGVQHLEGGPFGHALVLMETKEWMLI